MEPGLGDREGGVKIVFDVPGHLSDAASAVVVANGFDVLFYYSSPPSRGGSGPGWTRFGAERERVLFTDQERDDIVTAFEAAIRESAIEIVTVGVDMWEAW